MTRAVAWDGVERGYRPEVPLSIHGSLRLHRETAEHVDPVTFEVVRYALLHVNLDHGQTLQRLCVSPVTMLCRDFQPSVMLEDGELVFLGPHLQYFSNAQSLTVQWILEHRSANPGIGAGDMFVSNDPYVGTPHQPDTIVAAPVFIDGALFCWVANVLHHSDIGGSVPGSFCVDAPDMFSDPPAFPPFRLVEGGCVRDDLEQIFVRQSRLPRNVRMDLHAAVSANSVAVSKIQALANRYGPATVKAVMRRVLDASQASFVEQLKHIPDGTWSASTYAECARTGDSGVYRYEISVTKRGQHLEVTNRGTDPQVGSINVTYSAFVGAFLAALTGIMTSQLSGAYGGVYRCVRFDLEPGTLSCANFPAAVSPSGAFTMELLISLSATVVAKMLACGDEHLRDLVIGPSQPHWCAVIFAGQLPHGAPFIGPNVDNMIGSLPASSAADGVDFGGHFWIPEGVAPNVEELEQLWPILYLYRRASPLGADGAGTFRGGRSFIEAGIPWGVPEMALALYSDESFPKASGLFGAGAAGRARVRLKHRCDVRGSFDQGSIPQDFEAIAGTEVPLDHKGPPMPVALDSTWEWGGTNSAGHGDPLDRVPERVARDVSTGGLSRADALRVYGVVLQDGALDLEATDRTRRAARRVRLERSTRPSVAPRSIPESMPIRVIGGALGLVEVDGVLYFASRPGRALLGRAGEGYRPGCAVLESPIRELGREFFARPGRPGDQMVLREYLCPMTGCRLDAELARRGDPIRPDMILASR